MTGFLNSFIKYQKLMNREFELMEKKYGLIPIDGKNEKENSGKIFAIFVYPTKSLSRDQYPKIHAFAKRVGIKVAVFDGDTKQAERKFCPGLAWQG